MKNKKSFYLINLLIVLVISFLTVYKIIKENGIESFTHLKNLSILGFIFLVIIFCVGYLLEGLVLYIAIRKEEKEFNVNKGTAVCLVGALFSAITPLKTGYLPGVAYAYSKFNVKGESVIKTIAKTSFAYQFFSIIVCIIAYFVCLKTGFSINIGELNLKLKTVAVIGLIYNTILLGGCFILAFSPWLHNLVLRALSFILLKLKKIEDREKYISEKKEKMKVIREQISYFFKHVSDFIYIILTYFIKNIISGGLGYVIYLLLSKESFDINLFLYSIIFTHLISYITNLIPIPGASGTAEMVFLAIFSLIIFNSDLLTSTMILWRFFSYFMNIIAGFITFLIMFYKKKTNQ